MAVAKEKIPNFRQTINAENEVRKIESGYHSNLTWFFDEYPVLTVRKAILRYLLDHRIEIYEIESDWIEARICDLRKEEEKIVSGLWKDLLNWYIFNTNDNLVNRAFDFAISITKMDDFGGLRGFFYRSDTLKVITGRLGRSPEIYWEIKTPVLKLFLESFLIEAYQPGYAISDITMFDVARVIRCAIEVEDWQFLPLIEKVLYKLHNQKRPERYDFKDEVVVLMNLALLKEAVRFFREKTGETKTD